MPRDASICFRPGDLPSPPLPGHAGAPHAAWRLHRLIHFCHRLPGLQKPAGVQARGAGREAGIPAWHRKPASRRQLVPAGTAWALGMHAAQPLQRLGAPLAPALCAPCTPDSACMLPCAVPPRPATALQLHQGSHRGLHALAGPAAGAPGEGKGAGRGGAIGGRERPHAGWMAAGQGGAGQQQAAVAHWRAQPLDRAGHFSHPSSCRASV